MSPCLLSSAPQRSFYWHAAMHPAALAALFVVAIVATLYLYRAQQRIAPRGAVAFLTAVRVLLVACVFVMLLQPAVRWTHRSSTSGTLWVIVDSTGSMSTTDPQSTPVERLRWAEGLGYLSPTARSVKLDQTVADLSYLRDDLPHLRTAEAGDQFGEQVNAWRAALDVDCTRLEQDAKSQPAINLFAANLRQVSKRVADATAGRSADDARRSIPWDRVERDLSAEIGTLGRLADSTDRDFLTSHAQDAAVQDALNKISKLSRAQLATLQLTRKEGLADTFLAYHLRLASFADRVESAAAVEPANAPEAVKRLLQPERAGQATNLAAGLQLVADQASGGEPTNVLLVSDGRQNVGADAAAVARQLGDRGVCVFALAVGSDQPAIDAAVEAVDAPDWVFKDDAVHATARVRADGLAGKLVTVELWRDGEKLETKRFTPTKSQDATVVAFTDAKPNLGVHEYEVRVPELPGEENRANNHQSMRVSVKKEQLKALVVEDQPRWEYRHVVSYLARDPRVKLQTVLLRPTTIQDVQPPAPVKASPANPKTEADQLPATKEEWSAFDVILLGDVGPQSLSAEQQQALVSAVKDGGRALVVIAGAHNMPAAYLNAPLAGALPVSLSSDWSPDALAEQQKSGFKVRLAPEGRASVLSQFSPDAAENAAFWQAMPAWYWHGEQTQAKPSASVLWSITGEASDAVDADRRRALLATSSYGNGRVLYLAADQTWRLRQVNGENLQDRFWGQVIRWATGSDLPAGGKFARFGADKPRYAEGDPIVVTARLLKEDLTPLSGANINAIATTVPESTTDPATQLAAEAKVVAEAKLVEVAGSPGLYRATLQGAPAGAVKVSLRGAGVDRLLADVTDERERSLSLRVQPQVTVEQRDVNADKPRLAEIARAGGGGAMVDGPYASLLAQRLPQPKLEQTHVEQLGFFGDPAARGTRLTHWIFLGAFCLLITIEWVVRKAAGLV